MKKAKKKPVDEDRLEEVRRIFEDEGFANAALLEQWDGDDLEELRELLSDEEMQTLLDQLQDLDEVG